MTQRAPEYGSAACKVVTSRAVCSSAGQAEAHPEVLPPITGRISG
jgi:hypothetical protein